MAELFKKILIATDGSKRTQNAVEMGLKIARDQHSKVYAIYVVDTVTFTSIPMDVTWENMYQLLKDEGEEAVKIIKDEAEGVDVETHVLEGNPAVEITKFASRQRRRPHRNGHAGQERHRPHPTGQHGREGHSHSPLPGPGHKERKEIN